MGTGTQENFEPLKWGRQMAEKRTPASETFEINGCSLYVEFVVLCGVCVLSDRGLSFTEWIAFLRFSISGLREGGRVTRTKVREPWGTKTFPLFLTLSVKSSVLTDVQLESCLSGRIFLVIYC